MGLLRLRSIMAATIFLLFMAPVVQAEDEPSKKQAPGREARSATDKRILSVDSGDLSGIWIKDGKEWRIKHNPQDGKIAILGPIKHLPGQYYEFAGTVKGNTVVATYRATDLNVLNPEVPEKVRQQDIRRPPVWTLTLKITRKGTLEGTSEMQHIYWDRKTLKITKVEPEIRKIALRKKVATQGRKSPPEDQFEEEHWAGRLPGDESRWTESWLLRTALRELEGSSFGRTSRGRAIIQRLRSFYDGNDFTFVATRDRTIVTPEGRRRAVADTPEDGPAPGNARYERPLRFGSSWTGGIHSEEIYVGVDASTGGLERARQNKSAYYSFEMAFPDGSRGMAVVERAELIKSLVHEGLHAVQGGTYRVGESVSLEEEQDAFNAENEAARALGLPETHGDPGSAYPDAAPNPAYVPLR